MSGPPSADGLPSVSVVIPTYNRAVALRRAVDAALVDGVVREVIVVDDGSTDHTPAVIEACARADGRVRLVRVENEGAPRARDRGAREATSEVIVFVDDDVVVAPGTLAGHARHHRDDAPRVVIGAMPVALDPASRSHDAATRLYAADYEHHAACFDQLAGRDLLLELWGGHFSMRRVDALAVRLFSEDYPFRRHEDRDLGIRMAKAGLDATFDRSLQARHEHRRPLAQALADARLQVAGRRRLHELHGDVLGPAPGPESYAAGLRGAAAWLARLGTSGAIARVEVGLLCGAARASGWLRWRKVQLGAVAVARTIVQQREARDLNRRAG